MKQANVVASVILAAAVLLAAYAIGRLIRQARISTPEPQQQVVAEPNDANDRDAMVASQRINRRRKELTPEEKAALKAERAATLEQTKNLTEEDKLRLRDELRQQLRSKQGERGGVPRLSPEELASISRRWPSMTEEEKAAFRARMQGRDPVMPTRLDAAMRASPPSQESSTDQPAADANAPEPNKADDN